MKKLFTLAILLAFALISLPSRATVITSNMLVGNWHSATTWDLNRIPLCGDTIVIQQGAVVNVTSNVNLDGGGCAPVTVLVRGKINFADGRKIFLGAGGCFRIFPTGQVAPGNGGGVSNLININGQNWWQSSNGVLNGTANGINLGCGIALPVELLSYDVEYRNDIAELSFVTASERDLDYFVIEVSRDGSFWQELDRVEAKGNTTSETGYKIYDRTPFNGTSYYRLRSVNINGGSMAVDMLVGVYNGVKYLLYPVPVNKSMFLEGAWLDQSNIKVINNVGDEVDVEQVLSGDRMSFDFSQVKNGVYYLVIENQFTKKTEQVSVLHK